MDKDIFILIGLILTVFGIMTLLSNPIPFEDFPSKVSSATWFGIILFIGGMLVGYYGAKK